MPLWVEDASERARNLQGQLIQQLVQREGQQWPSLATRLGMLEPSANETYNAIMSNLDSVYPDVLSNIDTFSLPQNALDSLAALRDEKINAIQGESSDAVNSVAAALARNGMASSTTASRSLGDTIKPFLSALESANKDYFNSRLTLPGQLAADKYNAASKYGTSMASANNTLTNSLLNPYLDVWKSTAIAAQKAVPLQDTKNPGDFNSMMSIAGSIMGKGGK